VQIYSDLEEDFLQIYGRCKDYTMTSIERMYALYKAVQYIIDAEIPGDFVECGVWRGGSVMLIAETLVARGVMDRRIHLYDTFDGMSTPTEHDVDLHGEKADKLLASEDNRENGLIWCVARQDEVRTNVGKTGYPIEQFSLIEGKVEATIPNTQPPSIALLRLDTDWYESTRIEMKLLYPLLSQRGVLIVDDYGHWRGSRKAVDEYFEGADSSARVLFTRIDYTGRIAIKA
jgi:hypothetical protein